MKRGFLLWLFLGGLIVLLIYYLALPPSLAANSRIIVSIPRGSGVIDIATILYEKQLIRSVKVFEIYSFLAGKASVLKPGRYVFEGRTPLSSIISVLVKGSPHVEAVIVPGMTVAEVDERLGELGVIKTGELLHFNPQDLGDNYQWLTKIRNQLILPLNKGESLEGFLFPDTYYFAYDTGAKAVVLKILDNFEAKVLPILGEDGNFFPKIIMASLIEKEVADYEEQQLIAGIFLKRIKVNMPLQVDATIVYVKCVKTYFDCPGISRSDYKIDSPYNTYFYPGLTPGPISSPGLSAIRAVLFPRNSEYWYYLSDSKTQKTIFSKTLDEQNENRIKYLLNG